MPREKHSTQEAKYTTVKKFDTEFAHRLSDLITTRRKEIGTERLAEDLGVTKRTIELWAGRESRPDIERLTTIADYFGVTVDYLVGRAKVPAPTLELAEISEITGLSVEAVKNLHSLNISKDINVINPNYEGDFKSFNPDSTLFLKVFNLLADLKGNGGWSQHVIRNIASYLFYCDRSQTYEITKYKEEYYDYLVDGQIVERVHLDALCNGLKEIKNNLLRREKENGKHN